MSKDVFEVAEFEEWDSTEDVIDRLEEAFIETLEDDDTVLSGENEWSTEITADDAAQLMKLRREAPDTVPLISSSKDDSDSWFQPKNKKKTGLGVDDGYDSTTVYQITCPKCLGVGDIELANGWNSYCKCGHCGTYIKI